MYMDYISMYIDYISNVECGLWSSDETSTGQPKGSRLKS